MIAGAGFGALFGLSGYLMQSPETYNIGTTVALGMLKPPLPKHHFLLDQGCVNSLPFVTLCPAVSSATLGGIMGRRFIKTWKLYPAGTLAGIGAASTVWHANKLLSSRAPPPPPPPPTLPLA